jgi:nucleoside-diphosphate-sugar epimerase
MRIVVTGSSGKAGRWVVSDLRAHGHDVLGVDLLPATDRTGPALVADLTDLGQAHDVIAGAEAVVHLAAIPAWGIRPEAETFRTNLMSTYHVFSAAAAHRASHVVYASSETVVGIPFDPAGEGPAYAPLDEAHPTRPGSSYALSKVLGEQLAHDFARRTTTRFVGLRLSNIMEPADYATFPTFADDPEARAWNLWSYIDVRDVAGCVRAALETQTVRSEVFFVAADDTVMPQQTADLLARVYPALEVRGRVAGRASLMSTANAAARLGWQPSHRAPVERDRPTT